MAKRRNQAEFLADDGKNEIGLVFGNKAELLEAVAQTQACPTAGAKRDHGLDRPGIPRRSLCCSKSHQLKMRLMRMGSWRMETVRPNTPSVAGMKMCFHCVPAISSNEQPTVASKIVVPRSGSIKTKPRMEAISTLAE